MGRRLSVVVLGVVACGGGEPSPEVLCKHVLEVAKKSGAAISREGDPIQKCLADQTRITEMVGPEMYGKVASCIWGKSDIASIMNDCNEDKLAGKSGGGASEYVAKSKSTEARLHVKKLYDGARAYYLDASNPRAIEPTPPQFPEPSAGPIPPVGSCCKGEGGQCAPSIAQWDDDPWRSLMFSMDDPHRYSYEYKVDNAGKTFTVSAYGDLDCDGNYSTFSMTGTVAGDQPPSTAELKTTNEME